MLIQFFYTLRAAKLPVSVKEYLTLLEALKAEVIGPSVDDFYYLARATLVKDESHFDKFDRAFGAYFKGVELLTDFTQDLPLEWLRKTLELELSPEEKAAIEKMGWDELMETLKKRFEETEEAPRRRQQDDRHRRHQPFRRLRLQPPGHSHRARQGAQQECGEGVGTSARTRTTTTPRNWARATSRWRCAAAPLCPRRLRAGTGHRRHHPQHRGHAGLLDIKMVPERHNKVKVLLLMDVGGTMDEHIHRVEELFSASKTELKHLEFYYFHNCVYDFMWKNNRRRFSEKFSTWDVIRKYNKDYKLIFVGDATMSPYEILQPGGSVEYNNEEPGAEWLQRLTHAFPKFAWINPEPQGVWQYRQSISIVQQLMNQRMFPLTLAGLEGAMRLLSK